MIGSFDTHSRRFLDRWMRLIQRFPRSIVCVLLALTACIAAYTTHNFAINTDLGDMISRRLPFRQHEIELQNAFPALSGNLVVVIDAPTPEQAVKARNLLADRLGRMNDMFDTVSVPDGGDFFNRNGLLYLSVEELEELSDTLADMQPFMGRMLQHFSLHGLFAVLGEVVDRPEEDLGDNKRLQLFQRLASVLQRAAAGESCHFSWQEIMTGEKTTPQQRRRFIIARPFIDYSRLYPGKTAIDAIRGSARALDLYGSYGAGVRITGGLAINQDDLMSVEKGIGTAALASFILVGIVLYIGLGAWRLVLAGLITLMTGLVWTMGFAIAVIGSLNLISISFAVLFIGLGIDYSIQLCLRYRELTVSGMEGGTAAVNAAKGVAPPLFLCTITTAIGFYSFVPTAYAGASELGMISGTGMFINFFTNMTLLPSLLLMLPHKKSGPLPLPLKGALAEIPSRFSGAIAVVTIAMTAGAALIIPRVFFDFNPLNLSNPAAESVQTAQDLFDGEIGTPWTISVLAPNLPDARRLAVKLKKLPEVKAAVTIADFVPGNQDEKLEILDDIALFMPLLPQHYRYSRSTVPQTAAVVKQLEHALGERIARQPHGNTTYALTMNRLYASIKKLNATLDDQSDGKRIITALEEGMLTNLATLLETLGHLLKPYGFSLSDLPEKLRQQYIAEDGRCRIEVFSREDITAYDALQRFTRAVRTIAPNATDAPVTILESGRAIVTAFKRASLYALIGISLFLLLVLKQRTDVILILTPLMLAALLTAAAAVIAGIPFNFANIIILPLLLGIGVDYGIHILYRFRTETATGQGILRSSTARAVFFSALTTIVSFGSLSFLSHRGTASMGKLLTVCVCFIILCTLIILPAFLTLSKKFKEAGP